jgi:hypothetical protein
LIKLLAKRDDHRIPPATLRNGLQVFITAVW